MTYYPIYDTEHVEMLKRSPREDFIQAIRNNDRTRCLIMTKENI